MRQKLVYDVHNSLDPTRDSNVVVQRLVLAVSLQSAPAVLGFSTAATSC